MERTPTDSYVNTQGDSPAFVVPKELRDFSLVLGGPLFQVLRKAHLEGGHLELLPRRVVIISLLAWLPLLLLTLGFSPGGLTRVFFRDIEVHVRFLIALPILIAAEFLVHARIRVVVHRFLEWRIILPAEFPAFWRAVESAVKVRNSVLLEVGLIAFVYTFGLWVWDQDRKSVV